MKVRSFPLTSFALISVFSVPSRSSSRGSSLSKRSRVTNDSRQARGESGSALTSAQSSPLLRSIDAFPSIRDSSQEFNTIYLLADKLEGLALDPSCDLEQLEDIASRLDGVQESLTTACAQVSSDRISFAQYVHNL